MIRNPPERANPRGVGGPNFKPTGVYKVIHTFTDSKGHRWQADDSFPADDEVALKMALEKGQIRADGEPQEYVGVQPHGFRAPKDQQRQKPAMQNQQPRSTPEKSRA